MVQQNLVLLIIVALLGVGLVYVASKKDVLNVFSCPIKLVDGVYRSALPNEPVCIGAACPPASDRSDDVSVYADVLGLGPAAILRTNQVSPREVELVNGSIVLLAAVNNSILIGDTRPSVVESGKIYVSGRGVTNVNDPADFVTVSSESTFVSPDQLQFKFQFVRYKLGGATGWRVLDPQNADKTTTVLSGGQIPQWILGRPSASLVYDNPLESVILPSGPITQTAIACVDAPFTVGRTMLSIAFTPAPSGCFKRITGISVETLIELSAATPTTPPCLPSTTISFAAAASFNATAFPEVCFSSSACDSVLRSDNTTTVPGTLKNLATGATGTTLDLSVGCSSNRVLILCQQTKL